MGDSPFHVLLSFFASFFLLRFWINFLQIYFLKVIRYFACIDDRLYYFWRIRKKRKWALQRCILPGIFLVIWAY